MSNNLFSTRGVEETTGGGSNQKFIYGGVYHRVVIAGVESGTSANKGTPFVEVKMHTAEGGPDTVKGFPFYFANERSADMSMKKLKHIATKIVTNEEWESITATSAPELAAALNSLLRGQSLRMKFTAEQYRNSNGEVKEKATIGLPNFAEAVQEGAEYPVVADEDTKLTFDKTNEYDFKRLPDVAATNETVLSNGVAIDEDL